MLPRKGALQFGQGDEREHFHELRGQRKRPSFARLGQPGAAVPTRVSLRLPIDSPVRPRYAGVNMVGNRPAVGVRNPVCSTSLSSYLRAKNDGASSPESGGQPHPGNQNPGV